MKYYYYSDVFSAQDGYPLDIWLGGAYLLKHEPRNRHAKMSRWERHCWSGDIPLELSLAGRVAEERVTEQVSNVLDPLYAWLEEEFGE